MSLDLATIVEHLRAVEARHPDTTTELEPVIRALSEPERATVDAATAGRLLGLAPATLDYWLDLGILLGHRDDISGAWSISLAEVLRMRAAHNALAAAGGDDLTDEELAELSSSRPGRLPWQRAAAGGE